MDKISSKEREEIERLVNEYLDGGGEIKVIKPDISPNQSKRVMDGNGRIK